MLTVIIPALNEEKTIGKVVQYAFSNKYVSEVIVVDDHSDDDSVKNASAAGATVVISRKIGKGISMKEGLVLAKNEMIIFIDADIDPYPANMINDLAMPLINDTHDFVKASFGRSAGRVTELVAKPLLTILFPDLPVFDQPLSGMIAGRKSFLEKIHFYDDYGVDIGILIDMFYLRARIKEVNIGYIENKSKPWQALSRMSTEVSRVIVEKAFLLNIPSPYWKNYKFLLK